jgi:RNA polymerase sigma-70 factor (ECF subfamily)
LLRAWRHAGRARAADPEPWVRAIARREALRLRARAAGREAPLEALADRPGAEHRTERDDAALDVRTALAGLSAADRRMLFDLYWADRPVRDIAQDLGMPVGTVKIRMHRSRRRLESLLTTTP